MTEGTTDLARAWRGMATSPWRWHPATNQAGVQVSPLVDGEAGGLMVTCAEVGGRRAYLKPRRRERGAFRSRAAREKIVSDLAFDLGVRVPPALLYDRTDAPAGEEQQCVVSLVLDPSQWAWKYVKPLIVDETQNKSLHDIAMADLRPSAGRALALNAWVMQPDHNDHPHNIVLGIRGQEAHFTFLDYAFSLGHSWLMSHGGPRVGWRCWQTDEGWKSTVPIPFPPHMTRFLDRAVLDDTLKKIEGFSTNTIREVVERVPDAYMESDEKGIIVRGLSERRDLVRGVIEAQLPGNQS